MTRITLSVNREKSSWADRRRVAYYSFHLLNRTTSSESSVHVVRTLENGETMKKETEGAQTKTPGRKPGKKPATRSTSDDLRSHYDLDYGKSRPNRFASRFSEGAVAVVLDPDVASVFQSSDAVNSFLRSAISAMSEVESHKKKRAG
jgi:hypothetical protein